MASLEIVKTKNRAEAKSILRDLKIDETDVRLMVCMFFLESGDLAMARHHVVEAVAARVPAYSTSCIVAAILLLEKRGFIKSFTDLSLNPRKKGRPILYHAINKKYLGLH